MYQSHEDVNSNDFVRTYKIGATDYTDPHGFNPVKIRVILYN